MLAAARVLGYLLAVVAGAAAGLMGSFTFAYTSASLPVGLLVALCLCLAVFVAAGLVLRSRGAAAVASAGWLVTVGLLSLQRPEGDLVVPASTLGYCWLLIGTLVAVLSVAVPYATLAVAPDVAAQPVDARTDQSSGTMPAGR